MMDTIIVFFFLLFKQVLYLFKLFTIRDFVSVQNHSYVNTDKCPISPV